MCCAAFNRITFCFQQCHIELRLSKVQKFVSVTRNVYVFFAIDTTIAHSFHRRCEKTWEVNEGLERFSTSTALLGFLLMVHHNYKIRQVLLHNLQSCWSDMFSLFCFNEVICFQSKTGWMQSVFILCVGFERNPSLADKLLASTVVGIQCAKHRNRQARWV